MIDTCQLVDCPCGRGPKPEAPICVPPSHIGRRASLTESCGEVGNWLREHLPEMWHGAEPDDIEDVALRLLLLRGWVERGVRNP